MSKVSTSIQMLMAVLLAQTVTIQMVMFNKIVELFHVFCSVIHCTMCFTSMLAFVISVCNAHYTPLLIPFPQIDIIGDVVIVWRVKGENYQVCSVQYCVQQLCTVRCTHI